MAKKNFSCIACGKRPLTKNEVGACNSQQTKSSHVLQALKVPQDYIRGTIRITFGKENFYDDAKIIGKRLIKILRPCQINNLVAEILLTMR